MALDQLKTGLDLRRRSAARWTIARHHHRGLAARPLRTLLFAAGLAAQGLQLGMRQTHHLPGPVPGVQQAFDQPQLLELLA